MKTKLSSVCAFAALFLTTSGLSGQTLTDLTNFNGFNGSNPQSALLLSGSTLYGTTYSGGTSNAGVVFSLNTNGTGLTTVYTFLGNGDGRGPLGDLLLISNVLYGTTQSGGSSGAGTLFAVNTNGTGYTNVHNFTGGGDGAFPFAGLVSSSNTFFGTAFLGGTAGFGGVFRVDMTGGAFTNLHSFTGADGSNPESKLLLVGNTLYGTTFGPYSGGSGFGTVFKVNTDGSGFGTLYSFTNGTDGAYPEAGLVMAGTNLWGTASAGGTFGNGAVFSVNTNGGNFRSYPFNYTIGANPVAALLLAGNTLYGTATNGGPPGWGTVFQIGTDGSNFTNVYSFTDNGDGAAPESALILSGSTFYGTTQADDTYGDGSVFALTVSGLSVPLNISLVGAQEILTWSNPAFTLQATSNLTSSFSNVPGAASPYTNTFSNKAEFFRLIGN